jgi:hypothetical protein
MITMKSTYIFVVVLLIIAPFANLDDSNETLPAEKIVKFSTSAKSFENSMIFSEIFLGSLWNQTGATNNISSSLKSISSTEFFFAHHDVSTQSGVEIGVINISTGIVWTEYRSIKKDTFRVAVTSQYLVIAGESLSSNGIWNIEKIHFDGSNSTTITWSVGTGWIEDVAAFGDKIAVSGTFKGSVSFGTHSLSSRSGSAAAYSAYWTCYDSFAALLTNMSWTMATKSQGGNCGWNSQHTHWESPSIEMTNESILVHVRTQSTYQYTGGTFSGCTSQNGQMYLALLNSSSGTCKFASTLELPSSDFSRDEEAIAFSRTPNGIITFEALHPRIILDNGSDQFLNDSNATDTQNRIVVSDIDCFYDSCWVIGSIKQTINLNGTTFFATNGNPSMFVGMYNLSQESWLYFDAVGGQSSDYGIGIVPIEKGAIFSATVNPTVNFGTISISSGSVNQPVIGRLISDTDYDTYHDEIDAFPYLDSQWSDSDADGYGDNQFGVNSDDCVFQAGNSSIDQHGCPDFDGDGYSDLGDSFPNDNSQWYDTDSDGFGDNISGFRGDTCPNQFGSSTRNNTYGCPDADYDGWADTQDFMPNDASQWKDSDGDGYGNQLTGFQGDACPQDYGESWQDRFGCLDSDGDGWSDKNDAFPFESTQYSDRDLDGYGDNQSEGALLIDAFPGDTTQWNDTDGDGYGDNQNGNVPDRFPNDPTRWQDSDHDGVADEDDAFPDDATQNTDSDGDGYGDDATGNRGDTFPNDPTEWMDTDADGLGDNEDAFPFDPSQMTDRDGDGMGDNPMGIGADKFPDDSTQWSDIDGDGYGDNAEGTTPDAFIADPTQWSDIDGDGYGDNPTGRLADAFPNDPTQWEDLDGDGFGDNLSGNNPDPYLFDFDNDGYNDSIDPLPKLASPGDLDNDGVLDEEDAFPEDYREWADADGDGEGDNADTDDDNDGWSDTDEIRQGTDPFSSSSQPIDGFEVIIPGTEISLGAWDLIGVFGGVPVFFWIAFGFATRNGRTQRYEDMLRSAQSVEDLERISSMWEYSLMMRMLGPHQGIRLERLRADLEYEFLGHRPTPTFVDEFDQTEQVEKTLPDIENTTSQAVLSQDTPAQRSDENGYEWFTADDGTNFYRLSGSGAEWVKFEN